MSIVVAIQTPLGGKPQLYLAKPSGLANAARPVSINPRRFQALRARIDRCGTPEEVQRIGKGFLTVLGRHPDIRSSVLPLLNPAQQLPQPVYLYFVHRDEALESMPWETLYAPDVGFVAQNRRFAVARAQQYSSTKSEWQFEAPLRIMAVLGASGPDDRSRFSGVGQWQGIRDAILGQQLQAELEVQTCDTDLRDEVNAAGLPWARATLMHDRAGLFASIQKFRPHLLHFFCHGASEPTPHLQVASYKDWATYQGGSIVIEAAQLAQQADRHADIWLVTLNCCESAEFAGGPSSLSLPMIWAMVNAGIPTAVGMRQRIDSAFADSFCSLFYDELLGDFRIWLSAAAAGNNTEIHWAHSLSGIRLAGNGAALGWTIPIMQTRLDPFRLILTPPKVPHGPSLQEIRDHMGELAQLQEDRKVYAHLGDDSPIVRIINRRIAQIKRILGL